MYNNLFKSPYINEEQQVRIIRSNDIAAKKLDSIANSLINANSDDIDEDIMGDISAGNVASLLRDEDESGFRAFDASPKMAVNKDTLQSSNKVVSDIIANANAEAEEILKKARAEADRIKEEAYEEGSEKGFKEGYEKGINELTKQKEELKEVELRLNEEYKNKIDEIEPALVDTLTDIYEYVFNIDFSDRKEVILHLARTTLTSLDNGKKYTLKLSSEDVGYISMQKRELVNGTGVSIDDVDIIEDKSLTHGNAYIETDGGIFDCSVSTHMENLRKTLQVLSFSKD